MEQLSRARNQGQRELGAALQELGAKGRESSEQLSRSQEPRAERAGSSSPGARSQRQRELGAALQELGDKGRES